MCICIYIVRQVVIDPNNSGYHCNSTQRIIVICVHKIKSKLVGNIQNVYDAMADSCSKAPPVVCDWYVCLPGCLHVWLSLIVFGCTHTHIIIMWYMTLLVRARIHALAHSHTSLTHTHSHPPTHTHAHSLTQTHARTRTHTNSIKHKYMQTVRAENDIARTNNIRYHMNTMYACMQPAAHRHKHIPTIQHNTQHTTHNT